MKKTFLSFIFLLPCFAAAQDNVQLQKDSLRMALALTEGKDKLITYFRLTNLYYPDFCGKYAVSLARCRWEGLKARNIPAQRIALG